MADIKLSRRERLLRLSEFSQKFGAACDELDEFVASHPDLDSPEVGEKLDQLEDRVSSIAVEWQEFTRLHRSYRD